MEKMKKVWSITSTALVALVVACAVFLVGSRLLGYRVFSVLSGSMEPTYSVGDLLYVKEMDFEDIKKDDPITFMLNENKDVATHRVVHIDKEKQLIYTKGDANNMPDEKPVHYKNVIGVPQFSLPLLGHVSNFVQNPPGVYVSIAVGALLILMVFLPDILRKKKGDTAAEETTVAAPTAEPVDNSADVINAVNAENEQLKAELERLRAAMNRENNDSE